MAGLYIHIPFCESRCIYCGFYSTTSLKLRDAYVDALCREMELRPAHDALGGDYPLETIYLGGGTPSQLSGEQLVRLFNGIKHYVKSEERRAFGSEERRVKSEEFNSKVGDVFERMEITMECNPDDVTPGFCEILRLLPVNRISMGAQTFSDERLHLLRRRHNASEVRTAVERLREVGIRNISIDLMFGFPDETIDDWEYDISEALKLGVEHVSAYSLMYEEGTMLHHLLQEGKLHEVDEELSLQMYQTLVKRLTEAGFEHYEISNFARPGYRSRHNSSYWHEVPYIGIGTAAHSYSRHPLGDGQLEVRRSWNVASIKEYIASIQAGKLPSEMEVLDLDTRYNDLVTTALRTKEGIDLRKMKAEFGERFTQRLLTEAKPKTKRGLMQVEQEHLSLTEAGIYISDDIMSDFMIV